MGVKCIRVANESSVNDHTETCFTDLSICHLKICKGKICMVYDLKVTTKGSQGFGYLLQI